MHVVDSLQLVVSGWRIGGENGFLLDAQKLFRCIIFPWTAEEMDIGAGSALSAEADDNALYFYE